MAKGRRGGCLVLKKKRQEDRIVDRIDRNTRSKRTKQAIHAMDYEVLAKCRFDRDGTRTWSF